MITITDEALLKLQTSKLDANLVKDLITHLFMFTKNDAVLIDYEKNYLKIFKYSYGSLSLHSSISFDSAFCVMCIKWVYSPNSLYQNTSVN